MEKPWFEILSALSHSRHLLLYGPPGTGKSYTSTTILKQRHGDVLRMTVTPDTTESTLKGMWTVQGDEFVFEKGIVTRAMEEGVPVILDEVDRVSGSASDFLHEALDDADLQKIQLPTGETVEPQKGFQLWGTSNYPPQVLEEALRSRFASRIPVNMPHPAIMQALDDVPGLALTIANSYEARIGEGYDSLRVDEGYAPDNFVSTREGLEFKRHLDRGIEEEVAAYAVWQNEYEEILECIALNS